MQRENIKSVFIRRREGESVMSKEQIQKGLRSKKISDKEETMRHLIVNIINDPYYDQMLMIGTVYLHFCTVFI